MLFSNVHQMISRDYIFIYLKTVLPPNAFEAFLHGINFDKTGFCLGEKQVKLVNDECSSWYNREGNLFSINSGKGKTALIC